MKPLQAARTHYAWIVLGAIVFIWLIKASLQRAFGLFIIPLQNDFGWSRGAVSFAATVSYLLFLLQPFVGRMVDSYGPKRVIGSGLAVMGVGFVLLQYTSDLQSFYAYYLVVSIGMAIASGVPGSVLVATWFQKRRALAMSILFSSAAAANFALPALALLILGLGWRSTYLLFGLLTLLLLLPVNVGLIKDRPVSLDPPAGQARVKAALSTPLGTVMRTGSFWLLVLTFSVCGFAAVIDVHFVAFAVGQGIDATTASMIYGFMGLPMLLGAFSSGYISDKIGRKRPLSFAYFIRAVSLLYLIMVEPTVPNLYIFVTIFGFSYLFTAIPTSLLSGEIFGLGSMGVIFGFALAGHQLVGAIMSYLAGAIYDVTRSYTSSFMAIMIASFLASISALLIKERPRPSP